MFHHNFSDRVFDFLSVIDISLNCAKWSNEFSIFFLYFIYFKFYFDSFIMSKHSKKHSLKSSLNQPKQTKISHTSGNSKKMTKQFDLRLQNPKRGTFFNLDSTFQRAHL